jgi:hypothetical protein
MTAASSSSSFSSSISMNPLLRALSINFLILLLRYHLAYALSPDFADCDFCATAVLDLLVDPFDGHFAPHIMAVYAQVTNDPDERAVVYYDEFGFEPTLTSPFVTYDKPHIELTTQFKGSRQRFITMIGVLYDIDGIEIVGRYDSTFHQFIGSFPA